MKTLSDLQCESAKEPHWFMKAKVCDYYGWGTHTIERSHSYGECQGFVLVARIRISGETILLLQTDPPHPVVNQHIEPYREAFREKDPDLRYVRVGLKRTQARPSLGLALAKYEGSQPGSTKEGERLATGRTPKAGRGNSTICSEVPRSAPSGAG